MAASTILRHSSGVVYVKSISGGLVISSGQTLLPDGTAAAPSYTFDNYTGTGLSTRSGILRISVGGVAEAEWFTSGLEFKAATKIYWSGTSDPSATDTLNIGRFATGQMNINADSTHGVVLDVNTDNVLNLRSRAGADTTTLQTYAVGATNYVQAGAASYLGWSGRQTLTSPSAGIVMFENWAADAGFRVSGTTDGTAHVLTRAGADTATVRASKHTASSGSAAAPSIAGVSFPTTGLYWDTGDVLGVTTAGTLRAFFNSNGITVSGGNSYITSGRGSMQFAANALWNLYNNAADLGVQLNTGTAAPTFNNGTVTTGSNNVTGQITLTGGNTGGTVTFGAPNWSNTPFCVVSGSAATDTPHITAMSATAFTVAGITANGTFTYHCVGRV